MSHDESAAGVLPSPASPDVSRRTPFLLRGGRFYVNGQGQHPVEGQSGRCSRRNVAEMRGCIAKALQEGRIAGADARTELKVLDQMHMTLKTMGASLDDGHVAVVMGPLYPSKADQQKRRMERRRVKESRRKNRKPKKRRR